MTETEVPPEAPRFGGPFLAFFAVAILAAVGAVWEISYWVGVSAFTPTTIGTTLTILVALVAFFAWGFSAPRNE